MRSATPWETAFSRASASAASEMSLAVKRTTSPKPARRNVRAMAIAMAPLPVPTSSTRKRGAPGSRGRAAMAARVREMASSTSSSVSGSWDERARVDAEREAVELLDLPDVGDRLARLAADDERLEAGLVIDAQRGVEMGDDRGPVEPDDLAHEQLRVEPRRCGAGRRQSC